MLLEFTTIFHIFLYLVIFLRSFATVVPDKAGIYHISDKSQSSGASESSNDKASAYSHQKLDFVGGSPISSGVQT